MVANPLLPLVVGICAQPQHVVVNKTSAPERLSENHFLLWRGVKPEFICSLNVHTYIVPLFCLKVKGKGVLSIPALNDGVFRTTVIKDNQRIKSDCRNCQATAYAGRYVSPCHAKFAQII